MHAPYYSIVLFFFFFNFNNISAQNLSLKELELLASKKDYTDVDRYLRSQNWGYHDSEQGSSSSYNTITWAYNKNHYEDKAEGWFWLFTYEGLPNKIQYQFHTQKQLNNIEASLSSYGYTKIEGNILDGEVVTKYANSNYILALSYKSRKDEDYYDNTKTVYYAYLIKKAGIYDPDNGPKTMYDDYGNKELDYNLKNGLMHGKFTSYYEDGTIKNKGEFKDGKKHGHRQEYDDEGNLLFDYHCNMDSLDGNFKQYYYNGQLMEDLNYVNGTKHGPIITYYANGNKSAEYNYQHGKINGVVKAYEMDGKLQLHKTMVNGKNEGLVKEYTDGELTEEYNYLDDKLEGLYKTYENGFIKSISNYHFGEKNGETIIYYYDVDILGKLKARSVSQFKNNLLHGREETYIVGKDSTEELKTYYSYLNGILHGPFREAWNDTLKFGNYRNGKRHGQHAAYFDITTMLFGGFARTDSTQLQLTEKGDYSDGLKSGYWRYYSFGGLISEGFYTEGEQNGKWNNYYVEMVDSETNEQVPYAGELFLTETYEKGDLVKIERFSGLNKVSILCDKSNPKYSNQDTCYQYVYTRYHLIKHFKDGELEGNFYYKEETTREEIIGEYKRGQKSGIWTNISYDEGDKTTMIETYSRDELHGPYKFYINDVLSWEGNAKYGSKDGIFKTYFPDGKVERQYSYKDNLLSGEMLHYYKDGPIWWSEYYKADNQTSFTLYNEGSLRDTISHTDILSKRGFDFETMTKIFIADSVEIFFTSFAKDQADKLSYLDGVATINKYKNGTYTLYTQNYKRRIDGSYKSNEKDGLWTFYYPELDLILKVTYVNGTIESEVFISLSTNELFSGKLTIPDVNLKTTEVIKVKDGKRNGLTILMGADEKPIKKTTYKDGIPKE